MPAARPGDQCASRASSATCILNRRLVLEGQIGCVQERRESRDYFCLRQFVPASKHPLRFQQDQQTHQDRFALGHLTSDQSPCLLILRFVVSRQVPDENVGINAQHQRDSSSMGKGFLPFLCNNPASSDTRLFFTRIRTTPSGINVKLILSPVFTPKLSRIGLGIVV